MRRAPLFRLGPALLAILAALALVGSEARADAPRFPCPQSITPSAVWFESAGRLGVHLAVVHADPEGRPVHDGQTYLLEPGLPERLEEDFDVFAPLALRQVEMAVLEIPFPLFERERRDAVYAALRVIQRHLPYRVMPRVVLTANTELWVHRLAVEFFRRRKRDLTITSGTRTPEQQAGAMFGKLWGGTRYRRLYRKREEAEEIRQAYLASQRRRRPRGEAIAAMAEVIREQMGRGVHVSAHLEEVAVDVRTWDLSRAERRTFEQAVSAFEGMRLIRDEGGQPHFHLQVPGTPAVSRTRCPLPGPSSASAPTR